MYPSFFRTACVRLKPRRVALLADLQKGNLGRGVCKHYSFHECWSGGRASPFPPTSAERRMRRGESDFEDLEAG